MDSRTAKLQASRCALTHIQSGMIVSLGSGSTAELFVQLLGQQVQAQKLHNLTLVSTSKRTTEAALKSGLTLVDPQEISYADIGVDGADEVSLSTRYVIKGGGGCALRERRAADRCRRFMIIADSGKRSEFLGEKWALPIDVRPDCLDAARSALSTAGASSVELRRQDGRPFNTDDNNCIVDADFGKIADPGMLAAVLDGLKPKGLVNHGLFGMATDIVLADGRDCLHWSWRATRWEPAVPSQ